MKQKNSIKVLAVLITIVLVSLLFTQVDLRDIITTLQNINPLYLLAGFLLYTISYVFRAWRFHILLNKEVSIRDLFHIECVHNMMNNLLPARTGELSYIYLLKKGSNRTTGEGIATLVLARIFDFVCIIVLFFIAAMFTKNLPQIILSTIWIIGLLLLFFIAFLAFLFHSKHPLTYLKHFFHKVHLDQYKIGVYVLNKGTETITCLDKIRDRWIYSQIFLISLPIWLTNYLMVFVLMTGMNLNLPLQVVVLGSTFSLISTLLPVNGIAGFGTQEGFWVLIFVPLGLTLNSAIVSAFIVHIVIITYYVILGVGSIFWLHYKK
jgi:glycosyltransferase 2 family protein